MRFRLLITAAALVFLAAACNKTVQTEEPSPAPAPTPAPAPAPAPAPTPTPTPSGSSGLIEVMITDTGIQPSATIQVKKGTTVKFVNNSSKNRWPASAPHPTHTDYPEFDAKAPIAPGESWSFTFFYPGTWKFHDHLQPNLFGTIIVTE